MENTILLSFNYFNNCLYIDIFNYCNRFISVSKNVLIKYLNKLVKHNILTYIEKKYILTNEGKYILNQLNIYYQRIIINSYRKYKINSYKKYTLKEIRLEQQKLRNNLISNCTNICTLCNKKLPYFLLETAHIKPRCLLNNLEKNNNNNIIFLCRLCHVMFDKGYLGINNNILIISNKLNISEYELPLYSKIKKFTNEQKYFLDFHYKFIFKK